MASVILCVSGSLCVRALKEKRLELSTPHLDRVTAHGSRSACTDPKVQRSKVTRSRGYQMHCWRGYAGRYDCLDRYSCILWSKPPFRLLSNDQKNQFEYLWVNCTRVNLTPAE